MSAPGTEDLALFWPRAAADWIEAAPAGNGRLGAMVFGGTHRARWQVNDSTVWSGTPDGPQTGLAQVLAAGAGPERLAEARKAVRAGDHPWAERLLMSFEGRYTQEYLPFADLWMSLDGDVYTYRGRTLNLDNGVVAEEIEAGGRRIWRSTWVSRPAGTLCVALTVQSGSVDVSLELSSPLRVVRRFGPGGDAQPGSGSSAGSGSGSGSGSGPAAKLGLGLCVEIPVDGAPRHEPEVVEPLRYSGGPLPGYDPFGAAVLALDTDGQVGQADGALTVYGASRLLITLASSTSAADFWSGRAPADRQEHLRRAAEDASAALALGAERLLREHEADLRGLLGGMELTVGRRRRGGVVDVAGELLSGKDEQLTATVMVQYGRYLLACASRPGGGPPANLQGIWNGELRPAWSSNYTLNINTEMNYWGAWPSGLGACDEPLLRLVERLAETGGPTAWRLYGARGWVAHHNTDMWGWSLPVGMGHGNPSWALWMMGGVWLAQHVWDRFDFDRDPDFLRERAWPLLRGCAEFCLDWLVESEDGRLDTVPSTSPENLFVAADGTSRSLTVSTTMDIALIRALFERCLAAAHLLGLDDPAAGLEDPVCREIAAALPRLRPPGLTSDGRLREWAEDLIEQDPRHRHVSQLVAVYPLGQIDPRDTPELAAAASKTLDARGPGAMGWSWSWKIALRARLGQAAAARELFLEATRPLAGDPAQDAPVDGSRWGGLLPNLFSSHPPFQIDGNYGLMAAVLETVVQSRGGAIRVLPALPEQWPDGICRGLRCRGGLAVDLAWRGGALTTLTVHRLNGPDEPVWVEYQGLRRQIRVAAGKAVGLGPDLRSNRGWTLDADAEVEAPC